MNQVFPWRDAPSAEFAVIGDPVSHSLSPKMHQAAYTALGLPYRYVAVHVPAGEVGPALDHLVSLGYVGVNVTVPHKEDALNWCMTIEPLARRVRAANTLRLADKACINTDAPGFMETLARREVRGPEREGSGAWGFDQTASDSNADPAKSLSSARGVGESEARGRTGGEGQTDLVPSIIHAPRPTPHCALVLGAGGSARALAFALSEAGWKLRIYNRTRERALEMLSGLEIEAELLSTPDPEGADLILNTTSASLQGASLRIEWDRAKPNALAYDLMYAEGGTPFLREAAQNGLRTCDGLDLLAAQGSLAFEWWLGIPAPRHVIREALA